MRVVPVELVVLLGLDVLFARFQSATIVLSGFGASGSFFSSFLSSSFFSGSPLKKIGYAMKSEYFFTRSSTRQRSRNSSCSARKWSMMDVPQPSRSHSSTV